MRVCHNVSAGSDDLNLVACAALVPVMVLAERAQYPQLSSVEVGAARRGSVGRAAVVVWPGRWVWLGSGGFVWLGAGWSGRGVRD